MHSLESARIKLKDRNHNYNLSTYYLGDQNLKNAVLDNSQNVPL